MTLSSYAPESFFSQDVLGTAWRPGMFRNVPIPPVLLTAAEVKECRITLAARLLAAKPDLKTVKRDDYKAECIGKFGITGRDYQFEVWPSARWLAGLPKSARPGPKKQKIK